VFLTTEDEVFYMLRMLQCIQKKKYNINELLTTLSNDTEHKSVLIEACRSEKKEIVSLLLHYKANPNVQMIENGATITPLSITEKNITECSLAAKIDPERAKKLESIKTMLLKAGATEPKKIISHRNLIA
jgi:hypothetical protein